MFCLEQVTGVVIFTLGIFSCALYAQQAEFPTDDRDEIKNNGKTSLKPLEEYNVEVHSTFKYKPPEVDLQFLHMKISDISVGIKLSPEFDNMADTLGGILLHTAVEENNLNMIESLIDIGANLNTEDYDSITPLYKAIAANNSEAFTLLVDAGANLNFISSSGSSLVHISVVKWNLDVLKRLLQLGAAVDVLNNNGVTPLYEAAEQSNHQAINELLSHKANVNFISSNGKSLLHIAVNRGRLDVVKELIRIGSKIDAVDSDKTTPLYTAVAMNNPGIIKILIDNGANSSFVLPEGYSLLHKAILDNRIDIIQKLLVLGASMETFDSNGLTPLQLAIMENNISSLKTMLRNYTGINIRSKITGDYIIHFAVLKEKPDAVKILIQNGAELSAKNSKGYTPLVLAIFEDKTDIIEILYNESPVVNYKTGIEGNSPLHLAVVKKDLLVAEKLLKRGALVDAVNGEGLTPLCKAAQANDGNMIRLLVKHSANLNFKTAFNETPLHKAVYNRSMSSIVTLTELGADVDVLDAKNMTALCKALEINSTNVVNALLIKGANVNIPCSGEPPVYIAVRNTTLQTVENLIKHGVESIDYNDLIERSVQYNNPHVLKHYIRLAEARNHLGGLLAIAATYGSAEVIQELIKMGTPVNVGDKTGYTPIWLATMHNNPKAMKVLIDNGAEMLQRVSYNRDGLELQDWSLLHEATLNGNKNALKVLLNAGVDIDIRDSRLWTPLHYAAAQHNLQIIKELVLRGANIMSKTKLNELPVDLVKRRKSYKPVVVEWLTTGRIS